MTKRSSAKKRTRVRDRIELQSYDVPKLDALWAEEGSASIFRIYSKLILISSHCHLELISSHCHLERSRDFTK
jgi:hypothetical protein